MKKQNAFNTPAGSSQGAYDRARGGILEIEFKIPSEKLTATALGVPIGTATTKAMKATVNIDWELLPLVDVAGYKIEEEQVGPDILPYPPAKITAEFS